MNVTADTLLYTADNTTWPTADGFIPAGAEQVLSPAIHDDSDVFYAPDLALEGEVLPISLPALGRVIRRLRRPTIRLQPGLIAADDEVFVATVTTLLPPVEDRQESSPLLQPLLPLPLVEARSPRSVVFAKPRIAKLHPVAEPHKVATSDRILVSLVPGPDREATNAVVSDEEIMLILLEAA